MSNTPRIAALSSKWITLTEGAPPYTEQRFQEDTPNIRNILFSPKGTYFAYKNDKKTELVRCSDWSVLGSFPGAIKEMSFSPLDTYFITWQVMFTKDNVPGQPNLHVYTSATCELVQSFSQKQQVGWLLYEEGKLQLYTRHLSDDKCKTFSLADSVAPTYYLCRKLQWSGDEQVCAWQDGARVLLYEEGQLHRYTQHLGADKCKTFSLAPSVAPTYYLCRELQWSGDEQVCAWQDGARVLLYEEGQLHRYTQHLSADKCKTFSLAASFAPTYYLCRKLQWSGDEQVCAWQDGARVLLYEEGQLHRYTQHLGADKCKTFSLAPSVAPTYFLCRELQWSGDEQVCAWQDGARVLLYEEGQLHRYTQHLSADKCKTFSLAPSVAPTYYLATFTLGKSGQPSFWKIYNVAEIEAGRAVASKSSFQAEKAKFYWNRRGTNVLVVTQTEVDKTGGSYYGRQSLSFADVKGNSGAVGLSKEGPVHAVAWSPGNWNEWVAVYGHTPAKATIFNAKCEPLFEFGTGSWNSIYYSPDGSRLLLGGFGNIGSGSVEVWDPRSYKKQGSFTSPDTTFLQWDARAECVLTATTYPRLTVSNGYKIWHYTGALMHKKLLEGEHLLGISWQPGTFPKSELSTSAPRGLEDTAPRPSTQAYRPPTARGRPANFQLHVTEAPHRPGEPAATGPSKAAVKQKEKREKAKAKKAEERAAQAQAAPAAPAEPAEPAATAPRQTFLSTGDPNKDKKIKNLQKKLNDIAKLKETRAAGRPLELNQKAKVDSEAALLRELAQLKL